MADEGVTAQQASDDEAQVSDKWGDDIMPGQKAWLEERLQAWEVGHGDKRGPFDGEKLTGADVFWLVAWTLARTADEAAIAKQRTQLLKAKVDFKGIPNLRMRLKQGGPHLEGANLRGAHLEQAVLYAAHLERADLREAYLDRADLCGAQLEGADLRDARLAGANLSDAHVADVRWDGVILEDVNWEQISTLGDEQEAMRRRDSNERLKDARRRLDDYEAAVRANLQLAAALNRQMLSSQADHFAYRSQLLHRVVLRRKRKWLRYLGSLLLDMTVGYGYQPFRLGGVLVALWLSYAGVYLFLTYAALFPTPMHPLSWPEALTLSLQVMIGRSPPDATYLDDPMNIVGDTEALATIATGFVFANLAGNRLRPTVLRALTPSAGTLQE